MYEGYWNLKFKPFESGAANELYYPSEIHQGAQLKLRYCVEQRRGGAVLSGAGGLGKSLIVSNLFAQLADDIEPCVHLVFPQMPADQLLAFLATEIGGEVHPPDSISQSVRAIQRRLAENAAAGKHAVVAVDEAHLIEDPETLEALRLLLNFETQGTPNMTFLLVGQPQLLATLQRHPLGERIEVRTLLRPFVADETASYISHRLTNAGAERTIFESPAMDAIHALTRGIPRKINRLCDLALLIGYADQKPSITAEDIDQVCEEMLAIAPE